MLSPGIGTVLVRCWCGLGIMLYCCSIGMELVGYSYSGVMVCGWNGITWYCYAAGMLFVLVLVVWYWYGIGMVLVWC